MDLQIRPGPSESSLMPRSFVSRYPEDALRGKRTDYSDTGRIIGIARDSSTASIEAADYFVRQAQSAIHSHGRFNVALCGGGTAGKIYDLLSRPPLRDQVDWKRTHIYLVNELCLSPDDHRCCFRMLKQVLLEHVPVPLAQIHPILNRLSSSMAALHYNRLMQQLFENTGLDMILLQWGEYGHNCFFPNQVPVVQKTHAWAAELYYPDRNLHAVTLTMRAVYRARKVVFLISH